MFYEDLKQKRFAHFLTIQTAFLAFFALLAKDALGAPSVLSLTALVLIAIPPLIIAFYFMRVDTRSRAFVDTTNTRLLLIEEEWRKLSPDSHFSTYQQLFAILSRHDGEMVEKYWMPESSKATHSSTWRNRGLRMPANMQSCGCSGGFGLPWRV